MSLFVFLFLALQGYVIPSHGVCFQLDSVYPSLGETGSGLAVTIRGTGFAGGVRLAMYPDSGNLNKVIGATSEAGFGSGIAVQGDTAFVADIFNGLRIFDVRDPFLPSLITSLGSVGSAYAVFVDGDRAYVVGDSGFHIVNVSDRETPSVMGSAALAGPGRGIEVVGGMAYIADTTGLSIFSVANPASPSPAGSVTTPGGAVKVSVSGSHAYVADGTYGLQIIDLAAAGGRRKSEPTVLRAMQPTCRS